MDADVSTEEPTTQAAPEPPPPAVEAPAVLRPQDAPRQSPRAPSPDGPALIIIAVIIALALGVFVISQAGSWFAPPRSNDAYAVQSYTPPSQLISAGDHVLAHARPDLTSPGVVMFGPGVALTIVGRVSRGFGNDWYVITWNGKTAFIRQQDATPGVAAAPPPTAAHVAAPPHEEQKPDADVENGFPSLDTPPPPPVASAELTGVRWASRPSVRDIERAYPSRALNENQSGRVTLDCVASNSGALDCSIGTELPRGYGFGGAALDLSRQFRLEPTTGDGRSVAGGHIQVPVEFRAN